MITHTTAVCLIAFLLIAGIVIWINWPRSHDPVDPIFPDDDNYFS